MSNPVSNGKALEYAISADLINSGAVGVGSTTQYQARDKVHFDSRPIHTRTRFIEASKVITSWIKQNLGSSVLEVKRMPDVSIDVADLVASTKSGKNLRLSIKHNNTALKHSRPYSLAQACSIKKKSIEDKDHRIKIANVANRFKQIANKSGFLLCNQMPPKATSLLYQDVVDICAASISSWQTIYGSQIADSLFRFLVGCDFYKVVVYPKLNGKIEIQDFSGIAMPSVVTPLASRNGDYLKIEFNNKWIINCRIHTASGRISKGNRQLDLKFDVKMLNGTAPISRIA